jgi:hypothetical protein
VIGIRRDSAGQVLVVANLGKTPAQFALPGRFTLRSLVSPKGNLTALPPLAPRTAYIYALTQRP